MNSIKYTPARIQFEDMKQRVAALFLLEDIVDTKHKEAARAAINNFKEKIHEETGEVCYLDYCKACEAGCDIGHTYNPKYCCVADECPY